VLIWNREIIDESDVFIDVHKAIRRINPSPLSRRSISTHFPSLNEAVVSTTTSIVASVAAPESTNRHIGPDHKQPEDLLIHDGGPRSTNSVPHSDSDPNHPHTTLRRSSQHASLAGIPENVLPQLKFLGPANLAGNPKSTKYKAVKIKPAGNQDEHVRLPVSVGEGLGQVIQAHGPCIASPIITLPSGENSPIGGNDGNGGALLANPWATTSDPALLKKTNSKVEHEEGPETENASRTGSAKKRIVKSGSIVERVEHVSGVPKTVIETTSSGSDESGSGSESNGKEKRRGRGRKWGGKGDDGETRPLLGGWGGG